MEFQAQQVTFRYWWVEKDKLLAGQTPVGYDSYAAKQYLQHLLNMGMRVFINLQEEDEAIRKDFAFYHDLLARLADDMATEVSCIRVPTTDGTVINDSTIRLILDLIDSALQRNQMVYVHCMAGNGRTGTVIGCWLARHGLTGYDAIKKMRDLRATDEYFCRKPAPQKPAQIEKVRSWPKNG